MASAGPGATTLASKPPHRPVSRNRRPARTSLNHPPNSPTPSQSELRPLIARSEHPRLHPPRRDMKLGELVLTCPTGTRNRPLISIPSHLACLSRDLVLLAFQSRRHPPSPYQYILPALTPAFMGPIITHRLYRHIRVTWTRAQGCHILWSFRYTLTRDLEPVLLPYKFRKIVLGSIKTTLGKLLHQWSTHLRMTSHSYRLGLVSQGNGPTLFP